MNRAAFQGERVNLRGGTIPEIDIIEGGGLVFFSGPPPRKSISNKKPTTVMRRASSLRFASAYLNALNRRMVPG